MRDKITYSNDKNINWRNLKQLFYSVKWESGNYPYKLSKAIQNYSTVYSAWQGDHLIGLVCALDDGYLNAYIQYLLVDPKYQKIGVGQSLMKYVITKYNKYINLHLVSYRESIPFYEKNGFLKDDLAVAMYFENEESREF